GEITQEATDELAMARDLAEEMARRDAELAEMNDPQGSGSSQGQEPGKDGQGDEPGKGDGDKPGKGQGKKPGRGQGRGGRGGAGGDNMTEAERIERLVEQAKTLEGWLKQVERGGDTKAADPVHEMLEKGALAEIVERTERLGELRVGGRRAELSKEARELA